ncbi:DMT family transporter [Patescibacteria group bacterium]|nr:MAG: DMT family transporter [Patescibacteria group bacterium]
MSPHLLSIVFVFFGQFLNASVVLIDKYIVTRTDVSHPRVYAFYVGMISGVVIFLLPFGAVRAPDLYTVVMSLIIGLVFISSIVFLFSALKHANATDVVAWLAAVSTLTTFVAGSLVLSENLPKLFPVVLIFFIIGMILVGHFRFHARSFVFVVFSGILFGLSVVFVKMLFNHTDFVNGFFWSRMGNVVGAVSLLLVSEVRQSVFQTSRAISRKTSSLIIFNRVLSGAAFLSILYAIRLGSASIVNALSSLQFVFVFLMVFLLRKKLAHLYEHEFRHGHILHKVLAMIFIAAGFLALFL